MAQAWFEREFGKSKTISPPTSPTTSFTGDSIVGDYYFSNTFQITPTWTQSEISTFLSVYPIVVVPVRPIAFLDGQNQQYALVVFRDSTNQINARLQVYDVTPQYKQAHPIYDVNNFTGLMYQICLDGKVQRVCALENGQFTAQVNLRPNQNIGRIMATPRSCDDLRRNSDPTPGQWFMLKLCNLFGDDNYGSGSGSGSGGGRSVGCAGCSGVLNYGTNINYGSGNGNGNGNAGGGSGVGGTTNFLWGEIANTVLTTAQIRSKLIELDLTYAETELILDNNTLRNRIVTYLRTRGATVENAKAIKNNISFAEYQPDLLLRYLDFLTGNYSVFMANLSENFPLKKYIDSGFTFSEFYDLHINEDLFKSAEIYLIENNFDAESVDYIKSILKNLKDAKNLDTATSGFCSKEDLFNYVKEKNPTLSVGQLHDKIGTMFEDAWNAWNLILPVGGYEPNTNDAFQRFSPSRNANVAPDGFMKSIMSPNGIQYGVDQKAHWVECKASNKPTISLADYQGQIKGEIEALSGWNPAACSLKIAAMSYVTTIDMIPSPTVTKYANDRGIWILNSYPYFEIRTDGKMYITFTSVFPYSPQFGTTTATPTMLALKQTLSLNYVEFK
jgi:hypothetical protein